MVAYEVSTSFSVSAATLELSLLPFTFVSPVFVSDAFEFVVVVVFFVVDFFVFVAVIVSFVFDAFDFLLFVFSLMRLEIVWIL